jgi:hypothetical protein
MHPAKTYKFFYVYQTKNIINGKIYVGVHAANKLENRYLGSGVNLSHAIKKYGRQNFKKTILKICETYDEALKEERKIVTPEFVNDSNTYNVEIGGLGGKIWTDALREKMSHTKRSLYKNGLEPWNKGKKTGNFMSEDAVERLRQRMKGPGNHMYGRNVADMMSSEANLERCKKISASNRKPKSKKDLYKIYAKKRIWIVNEQGTLRHAVSIDDPRLLSGEFRVGRKWR